MAKWGSVNCEGSPRKGQLRCQLSKHLWALLDSSREAKTVLIQGSESI